MAGGRGVRTLLAPPGHPPVHQLRVAGEAGVGADAEAFHHARAEALEQRVGPFDEVEQGRHAVGVLEIDGDAAPAALHQVGRHPAGAPDDLRPLDAHDLGAEVGEEHGRERARPDAGELDDPVAGERLPLCPVDAAAARQSSSPAAAVNATIDGTMIGHISRGRS